MTGARAYFLFCLRLHLRQRRETALPLFFFLMVSALFPMAFPARLLPEIAPVALWVSVLLSVLLSLNGLFRDDVDDGFLAQLMLGPAPLPLLLAAKLAAHALGHVLPVFAALPVFGLWYGLSVPMLGVLALSLALGLPGLLVTGGIAAALSAGLRQGGLLLMLITLPLATPVLLFALSMADMAANGLPWSAPAHLLLAMTLAGMGLGPWVMAFALKLGAD